MRKSFAVFLVGVVGGTIWLLLQNFTIDGLKDFKLETKNPAATTDAGSVPVSIGANSAHTTIRIASFNIEAFGQAKIAKPNVVDILAKIVQRFDIVAIQEIRSAKADVLPRFIEALNQGGRHYDFVIGPRLGRTISKEQYAFIFDQETIEVDRNQLYTIHDPEDALHREPLVGWFRARAAPSEQAFTFSLVNIHTDPDEVKQELEVLDDVFKAVKDDGRQEDDVILLGDLNTDDTRLGPLGRMPNILAAITGIATNTLGTEQYDNLLMDRMATTEFTGRSGVIDFMREFNLSSTGAQEVSDHLPVWAEFSVLEGGDIGRFATRPVTQVK